MINNFNEAYKPSLDLFREDVNTSGGPDLQVIRFGAPTLKEGVRSRWMDHIGKDLRLDALPDYILNNEDEEDDLQDITLVKTEPADKVDEAATPKDPPDEDENEEVEYDIDLGQDDLIIPDSDEEEAGPANPNNTDIGHPVGASTSHQQLAEEESQEETGRDGSDNEGAQSGRKKSLEEATEDEDEDSK